VLTLSPLVRLSDRLVCQRPFFALPDSPTAPLTGHLNSSRSTLPCRTSVPKPSITSFSSTPLTTPLAASLHSPNDTVWQEESESSAAGMLGGTAHSSRWR